MIKIDVNGVVLRLLEDPKELYRISPSAIKTWRSCQKLWGFQHIEKIRSPSSDAQKLGTAVHKELETWLQLGILPNDQSTFPTSRGLRYPGKIALAGIHLLPQPKIGKTEEPFYIQIGDMPWCFHGYIDYRIEGWVLDHKTTTSFDWALSEEDLLTDEQAIVYSTRALFAEPPYQTQWTYFLTHGRLEAKEVSMILSEKQIIAGLVPIIQTANEIYEAKQQGNVNTLQENPGSCGKYGGCNFRDNLCDTTPKERFAKAMGFDVKEFIAKQKAEQGAAAPEPPQAPAAPPPTPQPDPAIPPAPDPAIPPAPPGVYVPPAALVPHPSGPPVKTPFDPNRINTWDRAQVKAECVRLGLIQDNSRIRIEKLIAELRKAQVAGAIILQPGTITPIEEPNPQPTTAESAPEIPTEYIAPEPPPAPQPQPAQPTSSGIQTLPEPVPKLLATLYINCTPIPVPEDTYLLSDIVAPILRDMCPEGDYRLHPDLGFGKSAGALTEAMLERLADYRGASIIASTSYSEHRDCLAALEARASLVVRGL